MRFDRLAVSVFLGGWVASAAWAADLIRPKVVVVATFEIGADTGDKPGEFQFWVERAQLTNSIVVPGVDRPLRYNDAGVYGFVSGTTVRSAVQVMALLADPRFDFSKSYWLVNGIAGVDPEDASVGSAAWARWVVDGDIAYEIDPREAPEGWPYGIVPIGGKKPNEIPKNAEWAPKPMAWKLDPALVGWAYSLTKDIVIPETDVARKHRAEFAGFEKGSAPPKVILGESLGSCRYWHGTAMTRWANDWTRLHTKGEGDFVMTNMEDHGICTAMERMAKLGKVDFKDRKSTRLNSSHITISYAVFCLKKKTNKKRR